MARDLVPSVGAFLHLAVGRELELRARAGQLSPEQVQALNRSPRMRRRRTTR